MVNQVLEQQQQEQAQEINNLNDSIMSKGSGNSKHRKKYFDDDVSGQRRSNKTKIKPKYHNNL